jgi:DNA-binding CsgD family transcriptional regulator
LPPESINLLTSDEKSATANGSSGDLSAFSKEELAVMNQILLAIVHARSLDALLKEVYITLNTLFRIDGCALYRMSDNKLGLCLTHGVGEYRSFLPDVIPQGSDLFRFVMTRWAAKKDAAKVRTSSTEQLSLFDDHPLSLFCPIVVDDCLVGALAAIHNPMDTDFLRVILNEAAMALELLCRADNVTSGLPVNTQFAGESQQAHGIEKTDAKLTTREKEVLVLLAEGLSNKEIAEKLFISPATCKHHVENILAKLQVRSRAAAVAVGMAYMQPSAEAR